MEFQEKFQTRGVWLTLSALGHQEINRQAEVACRTLSIIAHSLMVHAQVSEDYIHFTLMYTEDHILPVPPIKDLINADGDLTMPYKLATGTKPSISHLHVLFGPCVIRKATAHVRTKALNMCHQAQKGFVVFLLAFHSIKKGILCMYHIDGRLYLHTMLFLMGVALARWRIRHNQM